jgi:hypothetical protein
LPVNDVLDNAKPLFQSDQVARERHFCARQVALFF